jgi:DNA-binding transcriptional regulator YdaS (Cro superfamily)
MSILIDLMDAAKNAHGSDYKVAKLLGRSPQEVSDWRAGRRAAQPEDHALLAALAGQDAEQALVRAVLAKHADTPKGERLLSALGKAWRQTGAAATSHVFAIAGCFSAVWQVAKHTTMCIM